MAISEVFGIAAAVITALGGGSVIVLALSSWIGKVWANRLMAQDRAKNIILKAKAKAKGVGALILLLKLVFLSRNRTLFVLVINIGSLDYQ